MSRSMPRIRIVVACALVVLSGLTLTACSGDKTQADVTVVVGASTGVLNPYSPLSANRQLGELVFRGLSDVAASGEPIADLLSEVPTTDNGGISEDGRTVTLHLKDGVTWHDGRPLTSKDVVFTLGLLTKGALIDELALPYDTISEIAAPDARTVTLHLSRPDAPFVWRMVPYVLPEHLLGDLKPIASAGYWLRPVGSGPYRIESTEPGVEAVLVPVAKGDSPSLKVVFTSTAEEARAAYDGADAAVWVDGPSQDEVAGESVVSTAGIAWRAWVFDMHQGAVTSDATVRQAYLSLLPHESTAAVPPADPFGLPLEKRSPREPKAVVAELREAGWRMDDKTMVKGSQRLEVNNAIRTLLSEELPWFEAVTARMADAGIVFGTYALDNLDIGGYYERDYLTGREWNVARTRYYVGMPYGVAWPFESGDAPSWENPGGGNVFGVDDAELDRAYAELRESGSPEQAAKAWTELGKRLDAVGLISWEYPERNNALVRGVAGVKSHPSPVYLISSAPNWRLED